MRLSKYLQIHKLSFEEFGKMLSPPASPHSVLKWIKGLRDPRPRRRAEIAALTKGEVDGNSWMPYDPKAE